VRVLLTTIGSAGDVHPYIAIGVELRQRGHDVLLMTNPYFESRVRGAGLMFGALGTREEYLGAIADPRLVSPRVSGRFVVNELILSRAREHFVATRRAIREFRPHAALRHIISFGPDWALRREHVPTASASLTPLFWFSRDDPGAFGAFSPQMRLAWLWRAALPWARRYAGFVFDRRVNALRIECGLDPQRDAFVNGLRGDGVKLGLWSPAFRSPTPGDPADATICGFCVYDTYPEHAEEEASLEAFVARGDPPLVFTLGSSVVHHAGDFYQRARTASATLARRCVLLVGSDDVVKLNRHATTDSVHVAGYARYSTLFPRACAVIHHGGVGTTAQALRAGVPQLILPHANDEFDNALRAARLGAALRARPRASARTLAARLARLLQDGPQLAARNVAHAMASDNGPARAADALERLAGQSSA